MAVTLGVTTVAAATAPAVATPSEVAALVAAAPSIKTLPAHLTPSLSTATADSATVLTHSLKNCIASGATLTARCAFGDLSGKNTIVLWGDSHAEMWFPALNWIAKQKKMKLVALIELGCPVANISVMRVSVRQPFLACNEFRKNMLKRIDKLNPAVVVMSEDFFSVNSSGGVVTAAQWQSALEVTLLSLPSKASKILIGNTVKLSSPVECLARYPTAIQNCDALDTTAQVQERAAEVAAARATKTHYVNELPWECSAVCTEVVGHTVVYYSAGHITADYSMFLAKDLEAALKRYL